MSLLYEFVKHSGRQALPVYFGKLEINGHEHVPDKAPYIIAPNHQSAFLDAILMGVYHDKPVHFLTRSDVFVEPYAKALRALNMMPVYRIRDGYDKLSKNEEVFKRCEELLSQGNPVLIFPEGNMGDGHFLRPLTKGTARMAFQSQLAMDQDLKILPVGINYFHHDNPRYKCIINYGPCISVKDYLPAYQKQKAKALIALRNDLSERIKKLLVIPIKEEYEVRQKGLNRKNERYGFSTLREKLDDKTFAKATYFTSLKFIPTLLSLANPLAIYLTHYIMYEKLKERQFFSSLKYTLGFLLSMLWWSLLFISSTVIWNWKTGAVVTTLSILLLLIRSEIKKYTHPITPPISES